MMVRCKVSAFLEEWRCFNFFQKNFLRRAQAETVVLRMGT